MKEWILAAVLSGIAAVVGVASRVIFKKKPDNYIEEIAEKVIKKQTGVDVDLSPNTPDPDNFSIIDVTSTKKIVKKKEDTDQIKKKD